MTLGIRKMNAQDLADVDRIQRKAYDASLCERIEVLEEKFNYFSDGCWLGEAAVGAVGYMFSHPSQLTSPPALNKFFSQDGGNVDCYFIHDVAVQPSSRGVGVGRRLVERALRIAVDYRFHTVALVAVQNSRPYWERFGFRPLAEFNEAIRSIRESYGDTACYMSRRVASAQDTVRETGT